MSGQIAATFADFNDRVVEGQLIARIDREGVVQSVSVVSGPEILHKAAIEALMKWRFKPAIQDGVNVSSVLVLAFNFTN